MARELKQILLKELDKTFRTSDSCVLIDYCGLNSEQTQDLRSVLRKSGIGMSVVQNRIARRVFSARGAPETFQHLFRGPTAILHGEEGAVVASKVIVGWRKKNKDIATIKGGLFHGQMISTEEVESLAKLPDLETLRSIVASQLLSPMACLLAATQGLLSHFPGATKARHESLEKGGEGSGENQS